MRKTMMFATILGAVMSLALTAAPAFSQEDWKSLKRESKRMKINETAQEALDHPAREKRQG